MVTADEVQRVCKQTHIPHHDCAICGDFVYYLVDGNGALFFDSSCACSSSAPRHAGWQEAAGWINMQTTDENKRKIAAKFDFDFDAPVLAPDVRVDSTPPAVVPGSRWRHHSGREYTVLMLTNEHSTRPDEYPVYVSYVGADNGHAWTRKLSDWHRSMTLVSASVPGADKGGWI